MEDTRAQDEFLSQFPDEELHPDLAEYLTTESVGRDQWPMLQHPLVYAVPYMPQMNHWHNNALKQKREMLSRATKAGDWSSYLFLHERPYRFQALVEVASHEGDRITKNELWALIRDVWVDSENIWQNEAGWAYLFGRQGSFAMMDDDEYQALQAMQGTPFSIYRGWSLEDRKWGWSWTLDQERAEWFAKRFGDRGFVTRIEDVPVGWVTAYITSRNEEEIIVNPKFLQEKPSSTWDVNKGRKLRTTRASDIDPDGPNY
jgi:hypothetical protein